MRHLLGALALLLSFAACGEEDPQPEVLHPAPAEPVLVHATAGEGEAATEATELPDAAAVQEYAAQFDDVLAGKVQREAGRVEVGADEVLAAQVVAIGCDVPRSASYHDGAFVPAKVASPLQECFAPVTTVALAAVP
ncbi:hypothetical protein, partial [Nocardioides pyridinolyticus]